MKLYIGLWITGKPIVRSFYMLYASRKNLEGNPRGDKEGEGETRARAEQAIIAILNML